MSQKGSRTILLNCIFEQLRAARALLGWSQTQLAERAGLSLPTVKRVETERGPRVSPDTARYALQRALELGGIEFIDENGGGPRVRLRKRQRGKTNEVDNNRAILKGPPPRSRDRGLCHFQPPVSNLVRCSTTRRALSAVGSIRAPPL